ncbi:MAG TPA: sugar phosphate isomerase/epimerase family protein [Bryobacteraceae bacterium]|nr:sugar phosphate isomerase/epimerase family protein [Bryobacteraceae bacterium]
MKLAISNIAWEPADEQAILGILQSRAVQGLEIAPTKIWPVPVDVPRAELVEYRKRWSDRGIEIVAMQALLFGKPELTIFDSDSVRHQTLDYLFRIIEFAGAVGGRAMVFGSPKNRLRNTLNDEAAFEIAIPFFTELGKAALDNGVIFCVEPNPPQYGCDFIRTVEEGCALVSAVDHPGFRLHLDVSSMTLNGEDYGTAIRKGLPLAAHFHVSEPFLGCVGAGGVDHQTIADILHAEQYEGWISIEMRNACAPGVSNTEAVDNALATVEKAYLSRGEAA